jgi:hypothetical protein
MKLEPEALVNKLCQKQSTSVMFISLNNESPHLTQVFVWPIMGLRSSSVMTRQ